MAIDDRCKLFVAGLPDSITETVLRQLFEATGGNVVDVSVPKDRATGRPRGFGFVTLSTEDEARRAREELDGSHQSGRSIAVRAFQAGPAKGGGPASRSDAPSDRGGGGGGGGGGGSAEDRTLYIGNLPYDTTVQEVEQLFTRAGATPVVRVNLPVDPTGRARGFGFVVLGSPEAAQAAVDALRDAELKGRRISASIAHARGATRPPRTGPPMGGGGPPPNRPWNDGPRWAPSEPSFDSGGGGGGGGGGGTGGSSEDDDRRRKGGGAKDSKKKKNRGTPERNRVRREGEGMRAPRARERLEDDED